MIERLNNKKHAAELIEFCSRNFDSDFYFTEDNSRVYVTDRTSLNKMFKNCKVSYVSYNKGDINGVVLVWKSVGGDKVRDYVKFNVASSRVLRDLLTVLTWNNGQELYMKIKKDSNCLSVAKSKGFRFEAGRGLQVLLKKDKRIGKDQVFIKSDE